MFYFQVRDPARGANSRGRNQVVNPPMARNYEFSEFLRCGFLIGEIQRTGDLKTVAMIFEGVAYG
jgi:hypothetical protein